MSNLSTAVGFAIHDTLRARGWWAAVGGATLSSEVPVFVASLDTAAADTNASLTEFFVNVMSLSPKTAMGHGPETVKSRGSTCVS